MSEKPTFSVTWKRDPDIRFINREETQHKLSIASSYFMKVKMYGNDSGPVKQFEKDYPDLENMLKLRHIVHGPEDTDLLLCIKKKEFVKVAKEMGLSF